MTQQLVLPEKVIMVNPRLSPSVQHVLQLFPQTQNADLSVTSLYGRKVFGLEMPLPEEFLILEVSDHVFMSLPIIPPLIDQTHVVLLANRCQQTLHRWLSWSATLAREKMYISKSVGNDMFHGLRQVLTHWDEWSSECSCPHGSELFMYHKAGRVGVSWYVVRDDVVKQRWAESRPASFQPNKERRAY